MASPYKKTATDSSLPLPRYHQIYLILREQLAEGRFEAGRPMPGEMEFAARFGVSRVTVRAAMQRLERDGLILRQRGSGTFAKPPPPQRQKARLRANLGGVLENLLSMGLRTSARVIELETIPAPSDVAAKLQLAAGDLVQKSVRVRGYRNVPLAHITAFVPQGIARKFGRKELASKPMLALLEEAGVKVDTADQTISARLADHAVALALEVSIGAPLLAVERVIYDIDGRAVQFLRGAYRPDRYEYRMHLTRTGDDTRVWVSKAAGARA